MVLITPLLSGTNVVDKDGNTVSKQGSISALAYVTAFIRYCALVGLYWGTTAVIYSIIVIETPAHLDRKTPPVSPAMQCVMNLTAQFFLVFLLLEMVKTYNEFALDGAQNNAERLLEATLPTLA